MEKQTQIITYSLVALGIVLAGFFIYHKSDTPPVASTFVLTPSPIVSPTKTPEPVVTTWTTYKNDKYNFTIDAPQGWNQQEFAPSSGGFVVAFSPNTLPCATCTYVHEGYYSIKIFNQETDPRVFSDYTTIKQSLGKNKDVIPIHMGGITGILYGNTASVENHGWVYAVTLDSNNGNDHALASQIFQKAAASLTFTYLIFSN